MSQTFSGINTALRGLEAQQAAIDTTSHNIANASTPGYSRQRVELVTSDPAPAPTLQPVGTGQIGTGVEVADIGRAHDNFVQQQLLYQNGVQAKQQTLSDTLGRISQIYNDPGTQGFSTQLSNFLTSWQQLATSPSDAPTRAVVAERGANLAASFGSAATAIQQQQQDQDKQVGQFVQQINTISTQIADLNQQITSVQAVGQQPNDLRDKRDNLVSQLSSITDISYAEQANGAVNISLGGAGALVQGTSSFKLATAPDPVHSAFTDVVFAGQSTPIAISAGQLGGAIAARDVTLANQLTSLDTLANNVIGAVNGIHSTGYGSNGATGLPFFTGSTAATIAVNPVIAANGANIATAAAPNQPGDGSVALKIAQLQETPATGQTVTLQAQYAVMIGQLGVDSQQARDTVQTGGLILQQLNAQQSAVSSVSLNEEASNLIQYQHAYAAAARVISIIDQTISDMIKQLGG